jgi:hypothetical protein
MSGGHEDRFGGASSSRSQWMVVKIAGHKNAHRRRPRTTRISIPIDVRNELSCWRPDLTGDLPEPKIKRVFKPQGRGPSINSYFPRLYPLACHRGRLRFWNSTARGSRAGSLAGSSLRFGLPGVGCPMGQGGTAAGEHFPHRPKGPCRPARPAGQAHLLSLHLLIPIPGMSRGCDLALTACITKWS